MAVIGITASRKLEDYRQAILHVGGEPRVLEAATPVKDALQGLDGLLLTGGDDVTPARYGEAAHATVHEAEPGRDDFELALVTAARAQKLPIFAICRGIQVLNVACGGTLLQDIPSQVTGALAHSLPVPPNQSYSLAHEIWIDKDSLLARLMRDRTGGRHLRGQQPASSGGQGRRARVQRLRHRTRRRRRGDRGSRGQVLPRRSVASGKFLADWRIPAALRRISRRSDQGVVAT